MTGWAIIIRLISTSSLQRIFAVTEDKKSNLVLCVTKRHLFWKLDTNFNDRNIGVRIDGKIIPSLTNMLRNKSCLLSHDFSGSHIYYVLLSPSNFERILWVWKDIRSMISRSGNHILGVMVMIMMMTMTTTIRNLAPWQDIDVHCYHIRAWCHVIGISPVRMIFFEIIS